MEGAGKRKLEVCLVTILGMAAALLMIFPIIWLCFSSRSEEHTSELQSH